MWTGDEARNRFYQGEVVRDLRQDLGIELRIVPLADTADLINKLLNEKAAGSASTGSVDLVWINGENFRTAKQAGVLWGPFADRLPNIRYFDVEARPARFRHGHRRLRGAVAAGAVRLRLRLGARERAAATPWRRCGTGFTRIPAASPIRRRRTSPARRSSGMCCCTAAIAPARSRAGFDEALYARASKIAIDFLRAIKPHLWRQGETYPATPAELDRLFVNSEIDFSMSYGPTFASENIARGEFPPTVRTFVLREGTIANYSFLAIPFNAPNPAGALAVINEFMSPRHAMARSRAIGGLFPLPLSDLSAADRAAVEALPSGPATLPLEVLAAHRIAEADATYLERFERDWRREVLRR